MAQTEEEEERWASAKIAGVEEEGRIVAADAEARRTEAAGATIGVALIPDEGHIVAAVGFAAVPPREPG